MLDFEEIGRRVDREVAKLRHFLDTELKPNTKRGTVEALRVAAARLNELAEDCEKRWPETKEKAERRGTQMNTDKD
jgi:hypothetical protein